MGHWDADSVFEWLPEVEKAVLLAMADDGRVWVKVDEKEVVYHIDSIHHERIKDELMGPKDPAPTIKFLENNSRFIERR